MIRRMLPCASLSGASRLPLLPLPVAASAVRRDAEINVAQQYGIGYLPLMLMEEQKLIEKHAKAAGLDVKVTGRSSPAAT